MSPIQRFAIFVLLIVLAGLLAFASELRWSEFLTFLMYLAFGAVWMYGGRAFRRWRHLREHPEWRPDNPAENDRS